MIKEKTPKTNNMGSLGRKLVVGGIGSLVGILAFPDRSKADITHYADEIPECQINGCLYGDTISTTPGARIYDLEGNLANGEIKGFFADDPTRTAIGISEVQNGVFVPHQFILWSEVPYEDGRAVDFEFWNSLTDEETPIMESITWNPYGDSNNEQGIVLFGYGENYNSAMFQTNYGDGDMDGDIDLLDFGSFQRCYSGSNNPLVANCTTCDFDRDGDIDGDDLYFFQEDQTGPNP